MDVDTYGEKLHIQDHVHTHIYIYIHSFICFIYLYMCGAYMHMAYILQYNQREVYLCSRVQ